MLGHVFSHGTRCLEGLVPACGRPHACEGPGPGGQASGKQERGACSKEILNLLTFPAISYQISSNVCGSWIIGQHSSSSFDGSELGLVLAFFHLALLCSVKLPSSRRSVSAARPLEAPIRDA